MNDSNCLEKCMRSVYNGLNVNGRYYLIKKLGHGAFGEVHIARDSVTDKRVAVKVNVCMSHVHSLHNEKDVYDRLGDSRFAPKALCFGSLQSFDAIVMDLMGPSLETVFRLCGRHFSMNTIVNLGSKMIDAIRALHSVGFIHRDIKPSNFVLGNGQPENVYIIDFGVAKLFPQHISCVDKELSKVVVGTKQFSSERALRNFEQGRSDDLESLAYMLCYFFWGHLPWMNVKEPSELIDVRNRTIFDEEANLPHSLKDVLSYVLSLDCLQMPNYDYLKDTLSDGYDGEEVALQSTNFAVSEMALTEADVFDTNSSAH